MKKGVKTIILGGLLLVSSIVIPIAIVAPVLSQGGHEDEQFLVPGVGVLDVETPGRYYLWFDHRTAFGGKVFNRSSNLPNGLKIVVKDGSGEEVSFANDSSTSYSLGNRSKQSIGYFEAEQPGPIIFEVSGTDEELVFSAGPFKLSETLRKLGLSALAAVVCGLVGTLCVIWGIVKLVKAKQQERLLASQQPPPL